VAVLALGVRETLYTNSAEVARQENPAWSAVAGLSFAMGFNLLSLFVIGIWATGGDLPRGGQPYVVAFGCVLVALNVWRFIARRDADTLIHRMSSERPEEARRAALKLWVYLIGSPVAAAVLGWLILWPR